MAVVIADLMSDIEAQLSTFEPALTVFAFPPKQAVPPFAFVNMPTEITYDASFGRGNDTTEIDVYVCVADVTSRDSTDRLTAYAAGDASGIKAAIELNRPSYRVASAKFSFIDLAAASYAGVIFTVSITA